MILCQEKTPLNPEKFSRDALEAHNTYRQIHNAPELKLNNDISKIAQKLAEKLALNEELKHSKRDYHGKRLGENLAMFSGETRLNAGLHLIKKR